MKKHVDKEYADIILQLAWKYKNENPAMKGGRVYSAMDRTLETMDKYVANINRMGYRMYDESVVCMLEYLATQTENNSWFTASELQRVRDHLTELMK
ncbi:MAG: hypothetical protein IKU54_06680 [Oscillospiraceae bacterium]|nr:hypothetical protein [Oscillospiraceae bacterium]